MCPLKPYIDLDNKIKMYLIDLLTAAWLTSILAFHPPLPKRNVKKFLLFNGVLGLLFCIG